LAIALSSGHGTNCGFETLRCSCTYARFWRKIIISTPNTAIDLTK
jgi:hypothetical protein